MTTPTPGTQTVVVTGASAGVGRATARAFGAKGCRVALLARGDDGLDAARKDVEQAGGHGHPITVDVADPVQVDDAATEVEHELGPIDVWVNDAMTTVFAPVHEIEPHEFRRSIEVTFLGQVYGSMAALARMRPRDRGAIVNVGSALAYRAIPFQAPYCSSKFAVRGFTESLRTELLSEGSHVRVSMVHLPAMNTPQFDWCRTKLPKHPQPVPPIYEPEIAADAIVRVAEGGQRKRIVGSWNWMLVQLNKLMPGVLDFYAAETGYSSQQTNDDVSPDRPNNLEKAVDAEGRGDWGAHGSFGDKSRGVLDPSFVRTLPSTLKSFGEAIVLRARDVADHPPR